MKQRLLDALAKLDAMSLRERVMLFAAAAIVMVALVNTLVWTPLQAKQKRLTLQQRQIQGEIAATQLDSEQKLKAHAVDPDLANRKRLQSLTQQKDGINTNLHARQKDLVPPENMAHVLENVLQQHPRLRLLALKTIDNSAPRADKEVVTSASLYAKVYAPDAAAAPGPKLPPPPGSLESDGPIFRHGVQVKVEGSYPDLLEYTRALEALPWQLYWGDMQLSVQAWPKSQLTFELFTLSLDRKWMNL